jgi:hypothetical protein
MTGRALTFTRFLSGPAAALLPMDISRTTSRTQVVLKLPRTLPPVMPESCEAAPLWSPEGFTKFLCLFRNFLKMGAQ